MCINPLQHPLSLTQQGQKRGGKDVLLSSKEGPEETEPSENISSQRTITMPKKES